MRLNIYIITKVTTYTSNLNNLFNIPYIGDILVLFLTFSTIYLFLYIKGLIDGMRLKGLKSIKKESLTPLNRAEMNRYISAIGLLLQLSNNDRDKLLNLGIRFEKI